MDSAKSKIITFQEYLNLLRNGDKELLKSNIELCKSIINEKIHPNIFIYSEFDAEKFVEVLYNIYVKSAIKNQWGNHNRNAVFGKLQLLMSMIEYRNLPEFEKLLKLPNKSYLDIGCGDGMIGFELAKKLDVKYFEMADVDDVRSNYYKKYKFYKLTPNKEMGIKNKYDIVSCFHIIHHADDFFDFRIKEIYNIMKPGAFLIIRESDVNSEFMKYKIILQHIYYEIYEIKRNMTQPEFTEWFNNRFKSFNLISVDELIVNLEKIGFKILMKPNSSEFTKKDRSYYLIAIK